MRPKNKQKLNLVKQLYRNYRQGLIKIIMNQVQINRVK